MNTRKHRGVAVLATLSFVAGGLAASSSPVRAAGEPLGSAPSAAAGSCWEIKQADSSSADGVYWLLTSLMPAPQQFYCDMTTDGGGWVLVGKGRNGWTEDQEGAGDASALADPAFTGGRATHQLSATAIDQLMGGGAVHDMADPIRLRRATNLAGTGWQEVRMQLNSVGDGNWTWSFGGGLPLQWYGFNGSHTNTSQNTSSFGSGQGLTRVNPLRRAETNWELGFAYGSDVNGTAVDSSFLYDPLGQGRALPFTLMYIRPRVTSTVGFTVIPDQGTPAVERRSLPSSDADVMPWGVTGIAGAVPREGSVEVQALLESNGRVFVGGNFRFVQRNEAGLDRVEQSFLAAFDANSGEWIPSFRPDLNEQVRALEVLPSGSIVAAGDFWMANGQPATAIVALDPVTGATDSSFDLEIENRLTAGVLSVNALDVDPGGEFLYLGGAFTHLRGGGLDWFAYMRNAARVSAATGVTGGGWNPEFLGTVRSVDASADASRVYAAGFFLQAGTVEARRVAAVRTLDGVLEPWAPQWSSTNDYQQAIRADGDRVWVGGSEHSLFAFATSTFDRTYTTIMNNKGDLQAIDIEDGVVFAGCHCNEFSYEGATRWPNPVGWSDVYSMGWVGAWDHDGGGRLAEFVPSMRSRLGQGTWAVLADSSGRLWVGGDFDRARTAVHPGTWTGSFVRFSPVDATAPATPGGFRVTAHTTDSVTLAWNGVQDPSGVEYHILRGDRPIAITAETSITVPTAESGRYFVRTADGGGNLSASTSVLDIDEPVVPPSELVGLGAEWQWRYEAGDPGAGWNDRGFDASGWQVGEGRFGWGSPGIVTSLDIYPSTSDRPLAAFFRHVVMVDDPSELESVEIVGLADDGAIFYVNGVEVARQNMDGKQGTYLDFSSTAWSVGTAEANPVVVSVPVGLLVPGENVIAVSTHLGWRNTPDLTFELAATGVEATGEEPENLSPVASFTADVDGFDVLVDGSASSDPDGLIVGYSWNFGDGTTAEGVDASHSYAAAGDYEIELVVVDSGGATDAVTETISIDEPLKGPLDVVNVQLTPQSAAMSVAWDAALDSPVAYWVQRREVGGPWVTVASNLAAASHVVSGLNPSLMYEFRVVARNTTSLVWGQYSDIAGPLAPLP